MNIYEDVMNDINDFRASISSLIGYSKAYSDTYKNYAMYNIKDTDLLKERIKKKIEEALNETN